MGGAKFDDFGGGCIRWHLDDSGVSSIAPWSVLAGADMELKR